MNEEEKMENPVEEVVEKKKRKQPTRSAKMQKDFHELSPGEGNRLIGNLMDLWDLPKVDITDYEAVNTRTAQYFKSCAEHDIKPSVTGYAFALGIDRRRLWEFANDVIPLKNSDVSDLIKKSYRALNFLLESYMQQGQINPVSGIWLSKNNFGYVDKQEVIVTPNSPLGDALDRQALEAKYAEAEALAETTEE